MHATSSVVPQDQFTFRASAAEYRPDDMRSVVNSSFCSMEYQVMTNRLSGRAVDKVLPMTSLRGSRFGGQAGIGVFQHDGVGRRVGRRGRVHIHSNWADDFVIAMPISARVRTEQEGNVADITAGAFVFLSTSKPFSAELSGSRSDDAFSLWLVRVSGATLRRRVPQIDDYCGTPVQLRSGAGNIMQGMFKLALTDGAVLSAAQAERFGDMLLTAVTNVAAEVSEAAELPMPRRPAGERLRDQVLEYIHANLSNPELGSTLLARHHQVSPRYVQSIFAASSMTVEAYIREARLLQCRECLRHPALERKAIIEIAMSWGFNDPAYFSRIYRARFGVPPSADRNG